MPEVIVFDLYGVIATHQAEAAKREIEALAAVSGSAEPFWDAYWQFRPPYDEGQSSEDYWDVVAAHLGVTFPDVPALIEADLESWTQVDPEMVALVTELAGEGRRLGLLSNIINDLVPIFERENWSWLNLFADRAYSCRIGVAKPNPRAYEICARRLDVPPQAILFFDDREENVEAARRAGMRAELFKSPHQVRKLLQ